MTEYWGFLKATADKPVHACRLVGKVEQTETKLETMYGADAHRMRGIGLSVGLNDRNTHLLLDTGAGGIMVSRKVAEKAGLTPISAVHLGGIGDKGLQSGYTAVADHIRIGELEVPRLRGRRKLDKGCLGGRWRRVDRGGCARGLSHRH